MANCASEMPARTTAGTLTRLYMRSNNGARWKEARARLGALGVDREAEIAVRKRRCGFLFAMGQVAPNGPGQFSYDEAGQWHCVIPELWDDAVVDLVAFPLDAPHRMASLRGVAAMLGEDEADRSAYVERATMLWDDPVQWLKAGGEGGVLLDRMQPPRFLADPHLTIICGSYALAAALHGLFSRPPPMPKLELRKGALS